MSWVKKTEAANGSPSVTPTQMHTCGQGTQTWGVMQHTKKHTKKARRVHICTRIAARLLQDPQTDDRQMSTHIHKAAATAAVHECRCTGRPPGGPHSYGVSVLKTWDSQSSWYPWALELPATCFSGQGTQAHPGARCLHSPEQDPLPFESWFPLLYHTEWSLQGLFHLHSAPPAWLSFEDSQIHLQVPAGEQAPSPAHESKNICK